MYFMGAWAVGVTRIPICLVRNESHRALNPKPQELTPKQRQPGFLTPLPEESTAKGPLERTRRPASDHCATPGTHEEINSRLISINPISPKPYKAYKPYKPDKTYKPYKP